MKNKTLKIILFWPWCSWKIAELALNNNHSLKNKDYLILVRKYVAYLDKRTEMEQVVYFLLAEFVIWR